MADEVSVRTYRDIYEEVIAQLNHLQIGDTELDGLSLCVIVRRS